MRERRVLMVTPHFPPDSSAASHRVRLLAPHLLKYGWQPIVLTVDPADYETRLDPSLAAMVPRSVRVVRSRAWRPRWTRPLGFGDLGLRAFMGLKASCEAVLEREPVDVLFVTIYPVYPALLGPLLKRRFDVKFVLDYQDPWVGAWGETVGGARDGSPDLKSRLSRSLGNILEPMALRAADAVTAVSARTYEDALARHVDARPRVRAELPIGFDRTDLRADTAASAHNDWFSADDGRVHLCYVGTLLPAGVSVVRTLFEAVRRLSTARPDLYGRLRLHFFGTSNQTSPDAPARVLPLARAAGIEEVVSEVASRLDYLDALHVLRAASGILLLGSTEPHYTASKLYPALMAERPLLAIFRQESSVVSLLEAAGSEPTFRIVAFGDEGPEPRVDRIADQLAALVRCPVYRSADVRPSATEHLEACALSRKLAGVFDEICAS